MEPFATVDDLVGFFRLMDAQEAARAKSLLSFATSKMRKEMRDNGVEIKEDDEVQMEILKGICCTIVARAMDSATGDTDVTAWGGNTVYTRTGDIYVSREERREMLKGCQKIGWVKP